MSDDEIEIRSIDTTNEFFEQPDIIAVATCRSRAVGIARLKLDSDLIVWLETIYVEPDYRRRGIARLLVGCLEDQARVRNRVGIACGIRRDNEPSKTLFVALGYRHAWQYKHDSDEILMFSKSFFDLGVLT